MKTFSDLLNLARLGSENVDYSDNTGIQDIEIYQYFTDAIRRLESVIFVRHPKAFLKQKVLDISASAETVAIPSDCYMKNRLLTVEWSKSATSAFYILRKGNPQERFDASIKGDPVYYIPIGEEFILKPINSVAGRARLLYQHANPGADTKRGVIQTITNNTTTRTLSALTLDASSSITPIDSISLNTQQFITIVDRYGVVKARDVEITGVDDSTGVVSLYGGSHVYDSDESVAVGDFVCSGNNTTFQSQLTDNCERFILQYVIWKMQKRDSNADNAEASQELAQLESDIVASYSEPDSDVDYVAILDTQYIGTDYSGGYY